MMGSYCYESIRVGMMEDDDELVRPVWFEKLEEKIKELEMEEDEHSRS